MGWFVAERVVLDEGDLGHPADAIFTGGARGIYK